VVLVDDRDEAIARYIAAASPSVVLALLDRVERAERLHSQAEAQIECRNELRSRAIRAEEDHRAAVEALETYESRIRDIADHVLGIQPPDVATIVLLDAIEREAGRRRIAQLQAEAAFAACAEAVGVMRETDGRAPEPGPVETAVRHIRVACAMADDRHDAVERAEKAEAVLRDAEWSGSRGWGPPCCPACEGFRPGKWGNSDTEYEVGGALGGVLVGHYPGCLIAALVESEKP
jgi:hypothetical protein